MKKADSYYVRYVENSTPKLKKFKKLETAKKFVTKFRKANPNIDDGYWVDYLIVGQLLGVDHYFEDKV
jgi:hypothetical protein